jgi:hypothetical protein
MPPLQTEIVEQVIKLSEYINKTQVFQLIEKAGKQRDKRRLNNLFYAAKYSTMHINSLYKRLIRHYFPLRKAFSPEELLIRWNNVFVECSILTDMKSPTQAVRFTNLHFKTIKKRKDKGLHTIVSENPFGFELRGTLPLEEVRDSTVDLTLTEEKGKKGKAEVFEIVDTFINAVDKPATIEWIAKNIGPEMPVEDEQIELSELSSYAEFLDKLPEDVLEELVNWNSQDDDNFPDEAVQEMILFNNTPELLDLDLLTVEEINEHLFSDQGFNDPIDIPKEI